jgi:thymidine kinase
MVRLEIITGPMFSGKTEELIRRLKRAIHAKRKVLILKPALDSRTSDEITAREKSPKDKGFVKYTALPAIPLRSEAEGFCLVRDSKCDVVGIDEAQFFEPWFLNLISGLLKPNPCINPNLTIIVAGLDMDAWGRPFGAVPKLMAMADEVLKVTAICFNCGNEAVFTQKVGGLKIQVEVGGEDIYEARCRRCWTPPTQ